MDLLDGVIAVLINDALFAFVELIDGRVAPPRSSVSVFVVLTAIIIESVSDLMADNHADA